MDLPDTAFPEGWAARPTTEPLVASTPSNSGVMAGWFGVAFGLLGIFSIGFIFVPIAAICSFVGLAQGLYARSREGTGVSFVGGMLTIGGAIVSPTVWAAVISGIVAAKLSLSTLAIGGNPKPRAELIQTQPTRVMTAFDRPQLPQPNSFGSAQVTTTALRNVSSLKQCPAGFLRLWDADRQMAFTRLPQQPCLMPHNTGSYVCDKDGCVRSHVWQGRSF